MANCRVGDTVRARFEGVWAGDYEVTGVVHENALEHLCVGANLISAAQYVEVLKQYCPNEPEGVYQVIGKDDAVFSKVAGGWRTPIMAWPVTWHSLWREFGPLHLIERGEEVR